ncbi:MAG: hypothetical protein K2X45_02065 [Phreatobacter sp.]|jgi:hypothetical protein|nr:hypothetical protein [Phreatobacter sp.]
MILRPLATTLLIAGIMVSTSSSRPAMAQSSQPAGTTSATAASSTPDERRVIFCNDVFNLYRQAANVTNSYRPTNQAVPDAVNIMTRQVYRSGAMERLLHIATAARCDLTPLVLIEKSVLDRIESRGAGR